tara:strand:+ start:158 stop:1075 length:918 start_codon:yes stop_codon:yes gene_type:complete
LNYSNNTSGLDSYIDIAEVMSDLWKFKITIILLTFLVGVGSVITTLFMDDLYKSSMLLQKVDDDNTAIPSQMGALASFTGIGLSGTSIDKSTKALEVLKTRDFFESLIADENFLAELIGINGYDKETSKVSYNEEIYNSKTDTLYPDAMSELSFNKTHKLFLSNIEITDTESGLINISAIHLSPVVAKSWLDLIFVKLNETIKKIELKEATDSLNYLKNQLSLTSESELKKVIAKLIEKQIQTLMISDISDDFVFSIVDSPRVPEKKFAPHRSLICIVSTIFGFLLICFSRFLYFNYNINRKIST